LFTIRSYLFVVIAPPKIPGRSIAALEKASSWAALPTSKADSGLKLLKWLLMGFMRALPPSYCFALKAALWAILERSQALERHLRVPVLGGWPGKHLERIAGAWFCPGASRFQRLAIGR